MSIDDISFIDIGSGLEVVGRGIEGGGMGAGSVADQDRAHNDKPNGTNGANEASGNENDKENHR